MRREPPALNGPETETREYRAWINMRSRCNNPNTPFFDRYGGRGIKVCPEWEASYETFLRDMGRRPSPQHSLDRIDVNGDYKASNCRWATASEQCRNLTTNRFVEVGGIQMTLAEAAERSGRRYNTVLYRLKRGWSVEQALRLPLQKGVRP